MTLWEQTVSAQIKPLSRRAGDRQYMGLLAIYVLVAVLIASFILALGVGASDVTMAHLWSYLTQDQQRQLQASQITILRDIRLPRILMALMVGAALAVSGVIMQGLFRNPLADPGLMGVSSGAGLGAVLFIVIGGFLPSGIVMILGAYGIVFFAFAGGIATSALLYALATRHGQTSIATLLLAGIALAAFSGAILGFMIYLADDQQLRDINFWTLGAFTGASWDRLALCAPFIIAGLIAAPFLSQALNALSLGEAVALHMGYSTQRLKNIALIVVSCLCGAAVAVSGAIGFVGIVVPHLLRLVIGPDHRYLLPCSALLGGSLLILADCMARLVVAPAEMPVGILTAAFGAPFFLWVLLSRRGVFGND